MNAAATLKQDYKQLWQGLDLLERTATRLAADQPIPADAVEKLVRHLGDLEQRHAAKVAALIPRIKAVLAPCRSALLESITQEHALCCSLLKTLLSMQRRSSHSRRARSGFVTAACNFTTMLSALLRTEEQMLPRLVEDTLGAEEQAVPLAALWQQRPGEAQCTA